MRMTIDEDLIPWLDTKAKPWKPKDNAPQDIKDRINEWLTRLYAKKEMINKARMANRPEVSEKQWL